MKSRSIVALLALLLSTTVGLAQSPAQKSFDVLKSLAGKWQGKDTLGHPAQITFRVTSGGSALLGELWSQAGKRT